MKKKIALLQFNVIFEERAANMRTIETMFRQHITSDIDIVCLPETWDLGFYPKDKLNELADPGGAESKAFLQRLATAYRVNIVGGSIAEKQTDGVFNTACIIDRQGDIIATYRKMHGTPPVDGFTHFSTGNEVVTFSLDGIPCGIVICYDLRFPELPRAMALRGMKLLFVPSHWPKARLSHWDILLKARAVENQIFVAGANGCGQSGPALYGGQSMLVDPWGEVIAACGESPAVVVGEIDFDRLDDVRALVNVYRDRKPDVYPLR